MIARLERLRELGLVRQTGEIIARTPHRILVVHIGPGYRDTEYWAVYEERIRLLDFMVEGVSQCAIANGVLVSDLTQQAIPDEQLQSLFGCPAEHHWLGMDDDPA